MTFRTCIVFTRPDVSPCDRLLAEEPTGSLWAKNMSGHFEQYKQQYAAIKAMDPHHPIFILDCPWITSPATEWWCARPSSAHRTRVSEEPG